MKRQTRFELLTGVHTCALPISKPIWTPKKPKLIFHRPAKPCRGLSMLLSPSAGRRLSSGEGVDAWRGESKRVGGGYPNNLQRAEERCVGKEGASRCQYRWSTGDKTNKEKKQQHTYAI